MLRQKIAKACGVEPNAVPELFADVLRFLACAAGHNGTITPTKTIDDALHEFILVTRLYASYCEETFGRFIHHTPDSDMEANQAQFRTFESLYAEA
jgi:hypothetical protein